MSSEAEAMRRKRLNDLALEHGIEAACHSHTTCIRWAFARAGKTDLIPEDLK